MENPSYRNIIDISKTITQVAENIDKETWGYRSGIKALDDAILGFHPAELIVIAGRPSIGKTSLATGIAMGISKESKTLYFSLELSGAVIQERMLCQQAELNYYEILKNGIGNKKEQLMSAAETFDSRKLFVDDAPTLNPLEFRQMIEEHQIECAIVDYVQLTSSGKWSENRVKEIDSICKDLRNTAKVYDIPVIMLAQLNRNLEQRVDKTPRLCDLRDSGAIEQLAQVVLLINRPDFYEQRDVDITMEETGEAEIIIAKNYNGPTGVVPLGFIPYSMKFVDKSEFE